MLFKLNRAINSIDVDSELETSLIELGDGWTGYITSDNMGHTSLYSIEVSNGNGEHVAYGSSQQSLRDALRQLIVEINNL